MKALVLAGGLGSRLRPLTQTGAKQLLPVGNKPIIHYVMENLLHANITDVVVIVGNETAVGIRQDLGNGSKWGLNIAYVHQDEPLGLAHCVVIAEDLLKGESFVMYLGDNMLKGGIQAFASAFGDSKSNAAILLHQVRDPREFGVAEFDGQGRLRKLVEKPSSPPSNWALTGIYFFDDSIFEATRSIKPSWRKELEITDAIQWLLDHGHQVDHHFLPGWWKDTGQPGDLLEANVLVLQDLSGGIDTTAVIDAESQIVGEVQIGPGVEIHRSVVRGPVIVGAGAKIENAYIGASTSLGAGCVIRNSEVSCSIIMEGAQVLDVPLAIDWSLIGRDAIVHRGDGKPKALNLILGDMSNVGLV